MRIRFLSAIAVTALLSACGESVERVRDALSEPSVDTAIDQAVAYPETRTVAQTDTYFGVDVDDPYRWLEADVREDESVAAWVEAQNKATFGYLETLSQRGQIAERLRTLWDFEKFRLPIKRGDRYFFRRNDGLQNQDVLFVQDGLDGTPRQLIDPNEWSEDGATALAGYEPSPDGKLIAYTIQDGGSDWRTVKVFDVAAGEPLEDTVEWVKFSGLSWAKDGSGFYYSRFPEPEEGAEFQSLNFNQALYFHKVGDDQSSDIEAFARPDDPEIGVFGEVSSDGRWLIATMSKGTDERYEVSILDLENPDAPPAAFITGFENDYSYIATVDGAHYFRTDLDAPKGRIVSTPVGGSEPDWTEIVPENDDVLQYANIVGGRLFASYLEDVKTSVRLFGLDGAATGAVDLPGVGTAGGFFGEPDDQETFFAFESFNQPDTLYRYDVAAAEAAVFKAPEAPFDPEDYVVRQEFYTSKDGTRVPMFIAHKKGLDMSDGAPTMLYGYGGFNISVRPTFSITRLAWMEMGGVYAVANIRGGGEYGKEWHDAGRLLNKQNVFDDFIAAGEHLIETGVTGEGQLAIFGGSNGGLLVGAVVNQRPELFGAAAPAVGVMDMLRFNQFTAGRYWTDDYGDPANEADFRNLYAYSPYHNIRDGVDYPPVLVTTADTDDRVVPGHSFKYIAALQAAEAGPGPHLIRIETRAGHGAGKPTDKIIEEYADVWAFFGEHTGLF
ncbi:MAG: prolyl oligopeptidase family serine peptidase [Pseudomonadota bacterium]